MSCNICHYRVLKDEGVMCGVYMMLVEKIPLAERTGCEYYEKRAV